MFKRRVRAVLNWRPDFKGFLKLLLALLIYLLIFIIIVPLNMLRVLDRYYSSITYSDINKLPETRIAIVFGAGLSPDNNEPSPILEDRINTAIELYKAGKVKKPPRVAASRRIGWLPSFGRF